MSNRRSLIEGIKPDERIDPDAAEEFIAGHNPRQSPKANAPVSEAPLSEPNPPPATPALPRSLIPANAPTSFHLAGAARVAIGARVRPELARALKHASLDRQLKGIEPYAIQEILEEALELWLHKHGLLP